MHRLFIYIFLSLFCISCKSDKNKAQVREINENLAAKQKFQGVWMDENSSQLLFRVKGDSIFYVDDAAEPVSFQIVGDSLILKGFQVNKYKIESQTDDSFSFNSSVGERIALCKKEIESGSEEELATVQATQLPVYREKTQKDALLTYQGKRYRGYSYINPSTKKVIRSEITEEGLDVNRIYYDNVIYICVYEGKTKIFGKDLTKQSFEEVIPTDFLKEAILSDMDFTAVDSSGYHYIALVCTPDGVTCYQVGISISFKGEWQYELVK
ncbi:MAG: DUF4738 domain-containing protein [Phocaeicola sp.]